LQRLSDGLLFGLKSANDAARNDQNRTFWRQLLFINFFFRQQLQRRAALENRSSENRCNSCLFYNFNLKILTKFLASVKPKILFDFNVSSKFAKKYEMRLSCTNLYLQYFFLLFRK
jgi:hypothetical protein